MTENEGKGDEGWSATKVTLDLNRGYFDYMSASSPNVIMNKQECTVASLLFQLFSIFL